MLMDGHIFFAIEDSLFSGSFEWMDDTPVDFINWRNRPDDKHDCATLSVSHLL